MIFVLSQKVASQLLLRRCVRRHVENQRAENRLAMAACTPGTFAVKSLTSQPRYSAGNTENRCEKRRCLHARQHRLQPYLYVIFSSRCVHARTVLEATFNLARSSPCIGVSIVLEFLFESLPFALKWHWLVCVCVRRLRV
jgi:hypothetical protein